ncbi:MAG: hypothetical protein LBR10_09280 [Prevotellaceae bacterium]|jgi:hypothetical protein|nr:hypothetical protein [Prevotellaceae bacterium]
MVDRDYIIAAFSYLGEVIVSVTEGGNTVMDKAISDSCSDNYWFTKTNILKALHSIADRMLVAEKLNIWTNRYRFNTSIPKRVGLIMAGNIPLVGFHDFLTILLSGNIAVIKPSSKDRYLIKSLCEILINRFPLLAKRIIFTDNKPESVDAAIATGSNNSARYFYEEYKDIPLLARKNRYSSAILGGDESPDELAALGDDIFSYFGLGCRNVSNIFVPANYDWKLFWSSIEKYSDILNHKGYNDCFRYRKAILDLSEKNYLTNGFVMMVEHYPSFSSIAAINYMSYNSIEQIKVFLEDQKDKIQCVVSHIDEIEHKIPFGFSQQPELTDYADGIDTMKFLQELR